MHLSRSNIFGLIQAMGFESSGALSFGESEVQKETLFRPVSKEELEKRIDEIESKSITIWDKKQRLSLAGVLLKYFLVFHAILLLLRFRTGSWSEQTSKGRNTLLQLCQFSTYINLS
jgi:hypothetical protein